MRNLYVILGVVFAVGAYFVLNQKIDNISQIELKNLPTDALVLDVRTAAEHDEIALKQTHLLVELATLDAENFVAQNHLVGQKIYILCKSGRRATKAAEMFEKAGYKNVAIIKGGIDSAKEQLVEVVE